MQFEVPWPLGPADGRYVLRGHAGRPDWVLVTETLGAAPRRRRNRKAPPGPPPAEVATGRATLIAAEPLAGDPAAWLRAADPGDEALVALARLNRTLQLYRIAAASTQARMVTLDDALVVRVGYGAGEQVSAGRWSDAVEAGRAREPRRRRRMLQPDGRFAALLGGYDVPLAVEELALRARADVDAGRWRETAFQLEAAFRAAPAELAPWRNHADMAARIDELAQLAPGVAAVAEAAADGGIDDGQSALLTEALGRLEAALRARSVAAAP